MGTDGIAAFDKPGLPLYTEGIDGQSEKFCRLEFFMERIFQEDVKMVLYALGDLHLGFHPALS